MGEEKDINKNVINPEVLGLKTLTPEEAEKQYLRLFNETKKKSEEIARELGFQYKTFKFFENNFGILNSI